MSAEPKNIVNLFREPSRIAEVMAGPWRDITVDTVAGAPVDLHSSESEHAGYVLSGVLTVISGSGERFTLRRGGAFAIPQGGMVRLQADAPASFLHIVLTV
ncbi:hypothetical protein MUN77_14670 [Leucobacter allii]|uniref:cupin domain-containing protein n=1 Tax=Leucobacter allii TaxID=2932247 RepID=UPI001FD1A07F|nr:cupin domain-containing protein [Leucobacter allii]UOR01354.1 hypothetical protein MUN77_14670 [Leucobacter allii]